MRNPTEVLDVGIPAVVAYLLRCSFECMLVAVKSELLPKASTRIFLGGNI